MADQRCSVCKFYQSMGPGEGICRRYPPTRTLSGQTQWSSVRAVNWCGEFMAAEVQS